MNKIVVIDPKKDSKEISKMLNVRAVSIDLSKSKVSWFNPFTGESSYIEELKEKAQKAIQNKNYRKAYRLLSKAKKWQKKFR